MACLYSTDDPPKDYASLNAYDKDYIKKHGFLASFIKSLDDRGLGWTDKYLENNDFWGDKEAYWL